MVERHAQRPSAMIVVRSLVFAVLFYAVTALFLLAGSWMLIAPRRWAMVGLTWHGRTCVALLRIICGTHVEIRGSHHVPAGGCLIISKHQSAWDTFALMPLFRDPAVVLKDELKWIPIYGWFCVKFNHILVKREKASVALKALIRDAKSRVGEGREIIIFPEGTRTQPLAPADYKPGYVALYEALNVPAVPLALNSGLYWPRRSLMRYPGTIIVAFQPPIAPGMARSAFRRHVEMAIEDASRALVVEAANSPTPPPLPFTFLPASGEPSPYYTK